MREAADSLAQQGQAPETDLALAKEASAFYLKLSESVLRRVPDHLPLAESVSAGFTQYAYAFVALQADQLDAKDAKAAAALRTRAAQLYDRARQHAMAALEASTPGFTKALAQSGGDTRQALRLRADQVGVAYWAAASWGSFIALSKDDPDAVADLPLVIRLAQLAWAQNPGFGQGALASLMATLEAARPGGSLQQTSVYAEQAIAYAKGQSAGVLVTKAETVALPKHDLVLFESLLHDALAISQTHRSLENEVMRQRALWLLDQVDDLF